MWMLLQVNILPKYKIFTHMTWFSLLICFYLSLFVVIRILGHNISIFHLLSNLFNWAHCIMFGVWALFRLYIYSFSWSLLVTWVHLFRDPCSADPSVRKFIEFSFESKQIPHKSIINNNNNVKYHALKLKRTFFYSIYWILNCFETIVIMAIDHQELRPNDAYAN